MIKNIPKLIRVKQRLHIKLNNIVPFLSSFFITKTVLKIIIIEINHLHLIRVKIMFISLFYYLLSEWSKANKIEVILNIRFSLRSNKIVIPWKSNKDKA